MTSSYVRLVVTKTLSFEILTMQFFGLKHILVNSSGGHTATSNEHGVSLYSNQSFKTHRFELETWDRQTGGPTYGHQLCLMPLLFWCRGSMKKSKLGICIARYWVWLTTERSGMARANEQSHSFTASHKCIPSAMSHNCLEDVTYCLCICSVSRKKRPLHKYNGIVFKILGKLQWNFYNWIFFRTYKVCRCFLFRCAVLYSCLILFFFFLFYHLLMK